VKVVFIMNLDELHAMCCAVELGNRYYVYRYRDARIDVVPDFGYHIIVISKFDNIQSPNRCITDYGYIVDFV